MGQHPYKSLEVAMGNQINQQIELQKMIAITQKT